MQVLPVFVVSYLMQENVVCNSVHMIYYDIMTTLKQHTVYPVMTPCQ
jgi:hypothetical protein